MKKASVIILLIALIASCFALVACKANRSVSIVPETLQLEVGSEVDWNGHVTVEVDGKQVDTPEITWTLKEGNPSQVGACKYTITYAYNGKDYTREGTVKFYQVVIQPDASYHLTVGSAVDWSKHVTVFVDGKAQDNPQVTWTKKSGDESAVGKCVYTITYQHNGKPHTVEGAVSFTDRVYLQAPTTPDVVIGTAIDFKQYVTVYVDNQPYDDATLSAQVVKGDPNEVGLCTYEVSCEYEGKTYSTQVVVRYHENQQTDPDVVIMLLAQSVFAVGDSINWDDAIIVYANGMLESNVELSARLTDGEENKEGECKYDVTAIYNGNPYTQSFTVKYYNEPVNPNDLALLAELFAKEYDSYLFVYHYYEVGAEDYYIHEVDKVSLGATTVWQVNYEDVSVGANGDVTQSLDYFFTLNEDSLEVAVYRNYGEDEDDWRYTKYSLLNGGFENYIPMAFLLSDVNTDLSYKWFVKVDDTHFAANSALLQEVAEVLFGVNDGETYTSIVITTDGTHITSVRGEYTTVGQLASTGEDVTFDSVVEFTWSGFGATTVTLPEATEYVPADDREVPEYVDPTSAEELTTEQQTALTEALDKTYTSITLEYSNDKGDMYYRYFGKLMLTPTLSYTFSRQLGQYKDWVLSDETMEVFCKKLTADTCDVWLILNEQGDFMKYSKYACTLTQFADCILIRDFGLTADMFGYVDGLYVILPDKLDELTTKLGAAIALDNYSSFQVLSFTIELDGNGNVTEWRLVADCTATDNKTFYWDLSFSYSAFDATTVTLPDASLNDLQDVTAAQKTELSAAFGADYSNVTINDNVNNATMYFVGEDVTVKGVDENGEPFTDVYKLSGGKYYEVVGGIEDEITKADFDYYVLSFDFSLINVDDVQYDAAKQVYYIAASALSADDFVFYYKGFFGDDVLVTGFAFTVEDGHVTSITAYFDNGDMLASATLSQFGTTEIPQ